MSRIWRKPVSRAKLPHACTFCHQAIDAGSSYVRYRFVRAGEDGDYTAVQRYHPECDAETSKPEYEDGWDASLPQPRPEARVALMIGRARIKRPLG